VTNFHVHKFNGLEEDRRSETSIFHLIDAIYVPQGGQLGKNKYIHIDMRLLPLLDRGD
jgi:hypothetical protein